MIAPNVCCRCGKDMSPVGDFILEGMRMEVNVEESITEERIDYLNKQLGKYSNGKGGCNVAICYECYINSVFCSGRR